MCYATGHDLGGAKITAGIEDESDRLIIRAKDCGAERSEAIQGAAAPCLCRPSVGPLLLRPAFKDYIWGGNRLKRDFGKETDMTPLAESWELSCHDDGPAVIGNGPWAGRTLKAYLQAHPHHLHTGADAQTEFPLLIKLIDAARPLSVQVHPDSEYARRVENANGKNEMWYVVDAEEGAGIYYGFKERISLGELEEAIRTGTLTDRLNWAPARPGDVFFIPAGTVHAIGAGLLIAEVQQSSNVTYRVYDYGRLGADGKPRALHIAKALDVALRDRPSSPVGPTKPALDVQGGRVQKLIKCPCFDVSMLEVRGRMTGLAGAESFHSLICLGGAGTILWRDGSLPIRKGQSFFVPAGMGEYRLEGAMKLLRTTL